MRSFEQLRKLAFRGFRSKTKKEPTVNSTADLPSVADILEDKRREAEFVNLQVWIDQPIIIISNGYPFISVGFGKDITYITKGDCPVLVFDCYSDTAEHVVEQISLASVVMLFDEFKLDALLKLQPHEIGLLFYGKYICKKQEGFEYYSEFNEHKLTRQDYLQRNDFGQKVKDHYAKQPEG